MIGHHQFVIGANIVNIIGFSKQQVIARVCRNRGIVYRIYSAVKRKKFYGSIAVFCGAINYLCTFTASVCIIIKMPSVKNAEALPG